MNVFQRAVAPTPKFFRRLRLVGLILTAASGALLTGGVLPAAIIGIVQHVASAGAVMVAVSQVTVDEKALEEENGGGYG